MMPGFRSYSLYRGFRLYVPLEEEIPRNRGGGFRVYAAISSFPHDGVELIRVPDCIAASVDEAIGLSMTYAMRLAEDGWWPSNDAAEANDELHSVAA